MPRYSEASQVDRAMDERSFAALRMTRRPTSFLSLALLLGVLGVLAFVSSAFAAQPDPRTADYLLHLPGIAGYHWVDRTMIGGLRDGGYAGRLAVHDWPGENAGLGALLARERNDREAQKVADAIERRYREHPSRRIVITAHSGGTGIAVWALEKLPADVKVDDVLLLASALSPEYDLTHALRRVRGKMYAFTSTGDALILGMGTRTFGTIDGVKCEAAGKCGFVRPAAADAAQYEKLVQVPYTSEWMRDGNIGDHIGPMSRPFSAKVLAPIVLGGDSPVTTKSPPQQLPQPAEGKQATGGEPRMQRHRRSDAAGQ